MNFEPDFTSNIGISMFHRLDIIIRVSFNGIDTALRTESRIHLFRKLLLDTYVLSKPANPKPFSPRSWSHTRKEYCLDAHEDVKTRKRAAKRAVNPLKWR